MKTAFHEGTTLLFAAFIVLATLKVMGYIEWSWLAVCTPLLLPVVPAAVLVGFVAFRFAYWVSAGVVEITFNEICDWFKK
jgi:hypothetical protein